MANAKSKAPAKKIESDIPVGSRFSPDLIDLHEFLQACIDYSGDKPALTAASWSPPVQKKASLAKGTRRDSSLRLEAAVQYGLLTEKDYEATDLTRRLVTLGEKELHEEFARHILLNLGGLRVVEAAQQMEVDGIKVGADSLARYCQQQGFNVIEHNTAINSLVMWMSRAGVFPRRKFTPIPGQVERLLGLTEDTIASLVNLNEGQRAFALALCRVEPEGWTVAADIRDLAEATYNVRIGRASLPNEVLDPLKVGGLIEYQTGGTAGGKSTKLRTTDAFSKQVLEPFLTTTLKTLDPGIIGYYRMRPTDIYADLASKDTYVKGKALEAYAVHIMRTLGLHFLGWRKRAADTTGQAEVDVLLTGLMGLTPTRWQVQCKNTPSGRVDLEDVSKEIGLLPITKATHVMLIANCNFTADAREYAIQTMLNSPVFIHLLDKSDYERVKKSPAAIGDIVRTQAEVFSRRIPKGSLWHIGA